MKNSLLISVFICSLLPGGLLTAQLKIHKEITIEQGLVQSQVTTILEDLDGYLWIGTLGGLSKWDGIQFRNFQTQDGVASQDIRAIHQAADGSIYIGTNGGGVSIYKNERFKTVNTDDGLTANSVRAIISFNDSTQLFGTDQGLSAFRHGKILNQYDFTALDKVTITSLSRGENNAIYISTYGKGVYSYKDNRLDSLINSRMGLNTDLIWTVKEMADSTLVISQRRHGIAFLKNGELSFLSTENGLPFNNIRNILISKDGRLLLPTTGGGLAIYQEGKIEIIDNKNGLTNNLVWNVYENRHGIIYLATWGGVSIFEGNRFNNFNQSSGLAGNIITAIHEGSDNTFYLGSARHGLSRYRNGIFKNFTNKDGLDAQTIWAIHEAQDKTVFIGTSKGLVTYQDGNFKDWQNRIPALKNTIYGFNTLKNGKLLINGFDGLFIKNESGIDHIYNSTNDRRAHVFSAFEGKDGKIYIGTREGGFALSVETPDSARIEEILPDKHIWSVYQREDSTLFFGTNGSGLYFGKDSNFQVINTFDGLTDNTIYSILEDSKKRLYLSTHKGINIVEFAADSFSIRHLQQSDGLASNECNQGAALQDSQNRLWFGTINGISRYHPESDQPNTLPPRVHITRVRVFEDPLPPTVFKNNFHLQHNQNYLKIDYVGINLPSPEKVRYRYRLSGIDPYWVETDQRFVQYTNLGHGDFTFEVKAVNEWGYWSAPQTLRFTIIPPFWQTWWFISAMILLTGGLIAWIVSYRFRQLLAIERLRAQIAADLHDDIGAGLTEISILGEVVTTRLKGGEQEQASADLHKIREKARDLVDNMSDIVWLVNPKRDSLFDLLSRLGDAYQQVLNAKGIAFKIHNLEALKKIRLDMTYRQQLFMIFKEALNNSIKHSAANEITLDIKMRGKKLLITLRDNGNGFESAAKSAGNGLGNIRERASKIDGKVTINSRPDSGTTVSFEGTIP